MTTQSELYDQAHEAALTLFRKVNEHGPESLSPAEQRVAGWAVRVLERPSYSGPSPDRQSPGQCRSDIES